MTEKEKRDNQKMHFAYSVKEAATRLVEVGFFRGDGNFKVEEKILEAWMEGRMFFDELANRYGLTGVVYLVNKDYLIETRVGDSLRLFLYRAAGEEACSLDYSLFRARMGFFQISGEGGREALELRMKALQEFQSQLREEDLSRQHPFAKEAI